MQNKPKKQHGGARTPGPGKKLGPRPKPPGEKRQHEIYRFHPSTVSALNKLPKGTRTAFVEAAVRLALDLPPLPGPDYMAVKEEKS